MDNNLNELIKDLFDYDADTGVIRRTRRAGGKSADSPVGKINSHGYLSIMCMEKTILAHRLCWFLHYGEWPEHPIDHIDGDRKNNAISNLRLSSRVENAKNSGISTANKSGVVGVCWVNGTSKWQVQIAADKKKYYLGQYSSLLDAVAVRKSAELRHGFDPMHGLRPSHTLSATTNQQRSS